MVVTGPVPVSRKGLCVALSESGFSALDADSLEGLPADDGSVAVLVVCVRSAQDLSDLVELRRLRPELVVVVVLLHPMRSYREALLAGAHAVVAEGATLEQIVDVVRHAIEGWALLPMEVVRELTEGKGRIPAPVSLSEREREWIQLLAVGATVRELAQKNELSEREMFRYLRSLYSRMGVRNRASALVRASQWGLLDDR